MNSLSPFQKTNATDAIRSAQRERAAYFNAVSWMTTRWLESMIDQGKMGNHWHIQYLYSQIEERFEELLTVRDKREAALRKLEWHVAPLNGDKSPLAEAQVAAGQALFNRIINLKDAICHLGGAKFRGFAHCQIICNDLGQPIKLDPVEQYYFVQDKGKWGVRPSQGSEAIPIDPTGWIWRECSRPIDEPASRRFIKVSLAEADYSGAVEDAGILALFLELPPNASPDQKAEFEKMAEYAINQLRAVVPSGTKLQTFGNTSGGSLNLFDEYLKRQEEKVIMLGTGGKLTVLASGGGLGDGGADVHDAAFDDLAINDAGHITEILHASLLEPWLRALFPGQEILAYFEIKAPDKSDVAALADTAVKVNSLGHKVSAAWVTDNLGVELESAPLGEAATNDVGPAAPVLNREQGTGDRGQETGEQLPTKEEATEALLSAMRENVTPAFEALAEILRKEELTDADFTQALDLCEAGGDQTLTDAWETYYSTALVGGWAGMPE